MKPISTSSIAFPPDQVRLMTRHGDFTRVWLADQKAHLEFHDEEAESVWMQYTNPIYVSSQTFIPSYQIRSCDSSLPMWPAQTTYTSESPT